MNEQIPEAKQTVLGLYVTSAEAYEKWQAAPRGPDEKRFAAIRSGLSMLATALLDVTT
jgi:hypothetical protein